MSDDRTDGPPDDTAPEDARPEDARPDDARPDDAAPDEDAAPAGGGARPAAKRPLTQRVLRLANRVHGFCVAQERADLAARVTAEAGRWQQQQLVVVVSGDVKRGKSSLLNALLDQPGLLPVDADVATSTHLVVRYGPEVAVTVTRMVEGADPVTETVDVEDLLDVASMRGNADRREGVTSVEVAVDHPLLESGVVLIDTPGVGGMSRGHRDLALAALARADVLLFTVSAQEPIARTELEFLTEASERIDSVVIVVTKADANTDDVNQAMLAEHREQMAVHLGTLQRRAADDEEPEQRAAQAERFARLVRAPVVLTSSFLAEQAQRRAEAGRAEQAERLRGRSGLAPLRGLVADAVDAREEVRLANLLALLGAVLADTEREQRARARAGAGDAEVAEEMVARQRELEVLGSRQARWRGTLATSIQRMQTVSGRLVTRELTEVRNHYRDLLAENPDVEALAESLPAELERSLHGAWNQLVLAVNAEFGKALTDLLEDLDVEGMEAVLGEFEMPASLQDVVRNSNRGPGEFNALEDGLPMAMQTYTFANIANAAAGALGLATGGLGLVAYGIGAAIAYPVGRMRRDRRQQQRAVSEYQRLVSEVLFGQEGVAKEFSTELALRILDVREEVERFIDGRLTERRKQLEAEHRNLQSVLRGEQARRKDVEQRAGQALAEIATLRQEVATSQEAVTEALQRSRRPSAPDRVNAELP